MCPATIDEKQALKQIENLDPSEEEKIQKMLDEYWATHNIPSPVYSPSQERSGETEQRLANKPDESQSKVETAATEGEELAAENTNTQENDEEVPEEEEEAPTLTLDEGKAEKSSQKPKFNTRKANEGDDQISLQKIVPLKREYEATEDDVVTEEEVLYTKRALHEKPLEIEVNFGDTRQTAALPSWTYFEDKMFRCKPKGCHPSHEWS